MAVYANRPEKFGVGAGGLRRADRDLRDTVLRESMLSHGVCRCRGGRRRRWRWDVRFRVMARAGDRHDAGDDRGNCGQDDAGLRHEAERRLPKAAVRAAIASGHVMPYWLAFLNPSPTSFLAGDFFASSRRSKTAPERRVVAAASARQ